MTTADIPAALALWAKTPGISLRDADSPEALQRYFERNPGTSFVAREKQILIGTILGGHDGRRAYLNHLAVATEYRRQGIGRSLVEHCLAALKEQGIGRCNLFVFADNAEGKRFWLHLGFHERNNLEMLTISLSGSDNA